jgi:hypothetical protein
MKLHCINILSVTKMVTAEMLAELEASSPGVDVVSTIEHRKIGRCTRYWLSSTDDLWAECELQDDAVVDLEGTHGESVVAIKDGKPVLCAVVVTSLPRGMLDAAAQKKSFADAVKAAVEYSLDRAGIGVVR